jgi:hypothetical protein
LRTEIYPHPKIQTAIFGAQVSQLRGLRATRGAKRDSCRKLHHVILFSYPLEPPRDTPENSIPEQ